MNLVPDIMTTVTQILLCWVQTPSDYDVLFTRTMRPDWALKHLPVLSQRSVYRLYTGYGNIQPNGERVVCHSGCGVENRSWFVRANDMKIICHKCSLACAFQIVKPKSGILGSQSLIEVEFPQPQARVSWRFLHPEEVPDLNRDSN